MIIVDLFTRTAALRLSKINIQKQFALNTQGQDYFVGDIHGHHQLLMVQLSELKFNFTTDRLFAVGDLIDRGLDSEKCIELLVEPWFHSALGNHEHLFLQGFDDPHCWQLLTENGGAWIKNWLDNPSKLLAWAHLMRIKMPLSMSVETPYGMIGIIHADSPTKWQELQDTDMSNLFPFIWQRQNFTTQNKAPISGIAAVFHGHNQVANVKVLNNQLWADTLQRSGRLTILSANDVFNYIRENKLWKKQNSLS
jgi:serine/threonine protein phosphatase 1